MAAVKNHRIHSIDHEFLKRIADEQREYIGRPFKLDLKNNMLIIFARHLPKRKEKRGRGNERKKLTRSE